MQQLFLS